MLNLRPYKKNDANARHWITRKIKSTRFVNENRDPRNAILVKVYFVTLKPQVTRKIFALTPTLSQRADHIPHFFLDTG